MTILHRATAAEIGDDLDYVISDGTLDRHGTIIETGGWQLDNFKRNPIALFNHDKNFIIGKWKDIRIQNGALRGRLELLKAGVSERLDEIRAAVEAGVLKGVSIGFKLLPGGMSERNGAVRYTKQELLEASLVSVPSNTNALQMARSVGISPKGMSLLFGESAEKEPLTFTGGGMVRSGSSGEHAAKPNLTPQRNSKMTTPLSKRIEACEARLVEYKDGLVNTLAKYEDGNIDEDGQAVVEEFNRKIESETKNRDVLKSAETALGSHSEPIEPNKVETRVVENAITVSGKRPFAVPAKRVEPKSYIYRGLAAQLVARITQEPVPIVRQRLYGDDEPTRFISDMITRAASAPATTTTTGWAAELVQTSVADFLDDLMPQSIYPGLAAKGGTFTFGRNGIVSIPSRTVSTSIGGSFVAQGAPIPVRQAAFAAVTLTPKKMGVISTFTREIAEHSTPAIEGLIRQAIQEDTAKAIDSVLLDTNAATTTRPAGLRNGVSGTSATAGANFTALVTDIKNLVAVLVGANSLRNPVWIMNPAQVLAISMTQNAGGDFPFAAEVNQGRLRNYPIIQSTAVTAGMVILVDAADFFSATGDEPNFTVNDTATLHMEDTTPLAIVTAGTDNTPAAPVRSLFQTDTIAVRMLLDINWAMRRTGVIAWTSSVTW